MKLKYLGLLLSTTLVLAACNKPSDQARPPAETHAEQGGHAEGEHKEGQAEEGHEDGHAENVVNLTADVQKKVGITTSPVTQQSLETVLTTTGEFEANPDRVAHVTTRVPGRVINLHKSIGDSVRAGEPLATLDSVELGQAQSAFLEALARHDLAAKTYERQSKLFKDELIAQKEVLAASNQLSLAKIDVDKAKSQLKLYGMTDARIASLAKNRNLDPTVPLLAPIGGVVVMRHLTLGEVLEPGAAQPAFTLTDVSELWVNANLFEKDLALVKEGQPATVTTPAYPGKSYRGRVSLISTALDPETRTAKARIAVTNTDRKLKPQMFATARIAIGDHAALAIPAEAKVQDQSETFVFVRKGPESFEKRPVQLGLKAGEFYPVTSGLNPGEDIVVKGAFTLKSELVKESLGHDH